MRRIKKYKYNPHKPPKPKQWLALDEEERIDATFHAIIENQAALGDEIPINDVLLRLQAEGLNRHDALHAVASVLSTYFWEAFQDDNKNRKPPEAYYEAVRQLTKDKWYEEYG